MSPTPCAYSYVVECCHSSRALRIRTLPEFLDTNVQRFFGEAGQEYFALGFFESCEAANRFVEARQSDLHWRWFN